MLSNEKETHEMWAVVGTQGSSGRWRQGPIMLMHVLVVVHVVVLVHLGTEGEGGSCGS